MFKKLAINGELGYRMLKAFFKECGHFPTSEQLEAAVLSVTGGTTTIVYAIVQYLVDSTRSFSFSQLRL